MSQTYRFIVAVSIWLCWFVVVVLQITYAVCGLNMHHTQATIAITINFS